MDENNNGYQDDEDYEMDIDEVADRIYIHAYWKGLTTQTFVMSKVLGTYNRLMGGLEAILLMHDHIPEETVNSLRRIVEDQPEFSELLKHPHVSEYTGKPIDE